MKSVPNYVKLVANKLSIVNDIPHNPIIINNIPNIFIVLFVVLSCRFGWRRSVLRLITTFHTIR